MLLGRVACRDYTIYTNFMISAKNVHIVGIGGIGTSAVAKWFLAQGATVSGSDVHESEITNDLRDRGIDVRLGHFVENVPRECDLVIYSRAVDAANVERQVASERGVAELSYPEFLGELSKAHKTIAVSGTNGKSTTTAMIASILIEAEYDPTVIVGTKVPGWPEGNLRIGKGDWFVVEACEHMASMLHIQPDTAVITNIEEDHLDFYKDINDIRQTFQKWIDCKKTCSQVVLNRNDEQSQKLNVKYVSWFGVDGRVVEEGRQVFDVAGVSVTLQIPGAFNAQNAAAALTAAHVVGVQDDTALSALAMFSGTWRRFEHVGTWKQAEIFSDYAHHPTAVRGSIEAFRELYPYRRLVIVFEPHQHSRTHEMFNQFVESFDGADVLILSEIYEVVGRTEERFESSKDLADHVRNRRTIEKVLYAKDLGEAEDHLRYMVKKEDVIVCMGAGSIDLLARKLV